MLFFELKFVVAYSLFQRGVFMACVFVGSSIRHGKYEFLVLNGLLVALFYPCVMYVELFTQFCLYLVSDTVANYD